jgi:hypothetical protein
MELAPKLVVEGGTDPGCIVRECRLVRSNPTQGDVVDPVSQRVRDRSVSMLVADEYRRLFAGRPFLPRMRLIRPIRWAVFPRVHGESLLLATLADASTRCSLAVKTIPLPLPEPMI